MHGRRSIRYGCIIRYREWITKFIGIKWCYQLSDDNTITPDYYTDIIAERKMGKAGERSGEGRYARVLLNRRDKKHIRGRRDTKFRYKQKTASCLHLTLRTTPSNIASTGNKHIVCDLLFCVPILAPFLGSFPDLLRHNERRFCHDEPCHYRLVCRQTTTFAMMVTIIFLVVMPMSSGY